MNNTANDKIAKDSPVFENPVDPAKTVNTDQDIDRIRNKLQASQL